MTPEQIKALDEYISYYQDLVDDAPPALALSRMTYLDGLRKAKEILAKTGRAQIQKHSETGESESVK